MPVAFDEPAAPVPVRPSAALDLVWVLLWLQHDSHQKLPAVLDPLVPFPPELTERVQSFWPDESRVYTELIVLAHATGHLFDLELDPFFADLESRLPALGELQLRSESPDDRRLILDRLRRLHADASLRRRYVALLRDAWALVAETWRSDALPALDRGVRQFEERIARAADVDDVVPELARCDDVAHTFLQEAFRRRQAVFSPNYFGGWWLVLDLDDLVVVGAQFDAPGRADTRRHEMEVLSGQLRVLADPTRLAIVAHLAETPLNVTELTRALHLAQPTVSAHMRQLREAGLVSPLRRDGRTDYRVDRERVEQVLQSVLRAIPTP